MALFCLMSSAARLIAIIWEGMWLGLARLALSSIVLVRLVKGFLKLEHTGALLVR